MSMEVPKYLGSEASEREAGSPKSSTETTAETGRLGGSLIDDLKLRQREDEEKSSRLRGKLLKRLESATPEEGEVPKLRGTLLEKVGSGGKEGSEDALLEIPEEAEVTSRFRGKLIESHEIAEPYSKAWLMKQTFIQRDGKAEFFFDGFNRGFNGELIRLVCPAKGAATSQNLERFIQRLQTPGEGWAVKEN